MSDHHHLDDKTIEALLRGETPHGRDDLDELAGLFAAIRVAASQEPRPTAELAGMLAEGISPAPAEAAGVLPRRKKRMIEIAVAKLAGLSLAAKAGFGAAVAAAAVTGAGAAGVLPAPVQEAVAEVVSTVTPFQFPTSADDDAAFGRRVAEDATDPDARGVDGREVADEASDGRAGGDAAADARPEDAGERGRVGRPEGAERPGTAGSGDAGARGSQGLDTAGDTPAAGRAPQQVPSGSAEPADERAPDDTPPAGGATGPGAGADASHSGEPAGDAAHDAEPPADPPTSVGGATGANAAEAGGASAPAPRP